MTLQLWKQRSEVSVAVFMFLSFLLSSFLRTRECRTLVSICHWHKTWHMAGPKEISLINSFQFYFMWKGVLTAYMSVDVVYAMAKKSRRGFQSPWNWNDIF